MLSRDGNRTTGRRQGVGYLRCSTDKQPLSLEDQRRYIATWADQHGVDVVRWYCDDAVNGTTAAVRQEFQRMVRETEERRDVEVVLCYDVSRFGRTDTDEAGFYRFRLRQAGAEVVYVAETAINGSDTDDLLLPVLQYQKREFVRSLSRDTLRGLIGLASVGAWCGGPAPFGYVRELRAPNGTPLRQLSAGERAPTEDGSKVFLVPGDPSEVEALRLAWDLHHVEKAGLDAIRDRLFALGIRPRRGGAWRSSSIRVIVTNPVYTGRATYGLRTKAKFYRVSRDGAVSRPRTLSGKFELDPEAGPVVVENAHPSLVSEAAVDAFRQWEATSRERRRRREVHKHRNQFMIGSVYLLSGLARCKLCRFHFHGHDPPPQDVRLRGLPVQRLPGQRARRLPPVRRPPRGA